MPKITPSHEYQKTTMGPAHQKKIVEQMNKDNWNHSSTGSKFFKKVLEDNRKKYPELMEQEKEDS